MNMRTETAPAPAPAAITGRVAHMAIATAIELLMQSAEATASQCMIWSESCWSQWPREKAAYDKDLATVAALRTAQAEIEAPLLARLTEMQARMAVLEASAAKLATDLQDSRNQHAWLTQNDYHVQRRGGNYWLRQVMDACTISHYPHDSIKSAIAAAMAAAEKEAASVCHAEVVL